jgi:uncharacterized coiled-coil protein SlyX
MIEKMLQRLDDLEQTVKDLSEDVVETNTRITRHRNTLHAICGRTQDEFNAKVRAALNHPPDAYQEGYRAALRDVITTGTDNGAVVVLKLARMHKIDLYDRPEERTDANAKG